MLIGVGHIWRSFENFTPVYIYTILFFLEDVFIPLAIMRIFVTFIKLYCKVWLIWFCEVCLWAYMPSIEPDILYAMLLSRGVSLWVLSIFSGDCICIIHISFLLFVLCCLVVLIIFIFYLLWFFLLFRNF